MDGQDLRKAGSQIEYDGNQMTKASKAVANDLGQGAHHYLVQFKGPTKKQWLSSLKQAGIQFIEPYQQFSYIVRSKESQLQILYHHPMVFWLGHLPHQNRHKVKLDSRDVGNNRVINKTLVVEFFNASAASKGYSNIEKCAKALVTDEGSGVRLIKRRVAENLISVRVEGDENLLLQMADAISKIHGVRMVRRRVIKKTKNDVAGKILGVDALREEGIDLTGKGEIVAVCDGGFDIGRKDSVHPDFEGRVKAIKSYPISEENLQEVYNQRKDSGAADISDGHGTHVAGSVLGSGRAGRHLQGHGKPVRGIAYEAELVFQAVEQEMEWRDPQYYKEYGRFSLTGLPEDITDILRYAHRQGARIHSNSWGGSHPGEYDTTCRLMDEFIWKHKDFAIVVAAGNEGSDKDFKGAIPPSVMESPATAKNVITVGATESIRPEFNDRTYGKRWPTHYPVSPFWAAPIANNPYQVAAFSSRGPTNEGRIKPDVVAPGTYILSTRSRAIPHKLDGWERIPDNLDYFYLGGTSMSTPLVSGCCALLRQYFKEYYALANPSAALLKASLVGGATKLPGYSPPDQMADNHQGFGRVDLQAIVVPSAPDAVYVYDGFEMDDQLDTGEVAELKIIVDSPSVPLRVAMAYTDFPGPHLVNNLDLMLFRSTRAGAGRHYVGYGDSSNKRVPDATNNT